VKWRLIISTGLTCAALAVIVFWVINFRQVGHWFQVHTGTINEPGPYYGFWSGFGSDLEELRHSRRPPPARSRAPPDRPSGSQARCLSCPGPSPSTAPKMLRNQDRKPAPHFACVPDRVGPWRIALPRDVRSQAQSRSSCLPNPHDYGAISGRSPHSHPERSTKLQKRRRRREDGSGQPGVQRSRSWRRRQRSSNRPISPGPACLPARPPLAADRFLPERLSWAGARPVVMPVMRR
jgi:hypothetical protein